MLPVMKCFYTKGTFGTSMIEFTILGAESQKSPKRGIHMHFQAKPAKVQVVINFRSEKQIFRKFVT